jgi:hypothetical protein
MSHADEILIRRKDHDSIIIEEQIIEKHVISIEHRFQKNHQRLVFI